MDLAPLGLAVHVRCAVPFVLGVGQIIDHLAQGIEIYVAPTWDYGDTWIATLRHIAKEAGAWVIGCATAMQASDVPADFPDRDRLFPDPDEWINDGEAIVVKPGGAIAVRVATPVFVDPEGERLHG